MYNIRFLFLIHNADDDDKKRGKSRSIVALIIYFQFQQYGRVLMRLMWIKNVYTRFVSFYLYRNECVHQSVTDLFGVWGAIVYKRFNP